MPSRLDIGVTGAAPNLLGSLTAAARPLPENAEWMAFGVSHTPEHCGKPWVWQECTEATDEDPKPLNEAESPASFRPFMVEYNAQSCSGIPGDWHELEARARRGLAGRVSNGIARAISSASPDGQQNQSPNLPDAAVDITGVAPAGLANTIAGLLQDSFDCGATGEQWIWLPAWVLPHLLEAQLVTQVGNVYKLGPHTVILDQGFTGAPPTGVGSDPDVPASPDAATGQAWVYVSGPVEFATGPTTILDDTTRGVSPRLNRANVIAGQLAIYRFDPCCVFAALAAVC